MQFVSPFELGESVFIFPRGCSKSLLGLGMCLNLIKVLSTDPLDWRSILRKSESFLVKEMVNNG